MTEQELQECHLKRYHLPDAHKRHWGHCPVCDLPALVCHDEQTTYYRCPHHGAILENGELYKNFYV